MGRRARRWVSRGVQGMAPQKQDAHELRGSSATPERLHPHLQYAWWAHTCIDELHPAGCMWGCNSNRDPGRFACLTSCPTASTRALNFWALPCLRTCVCRGRRGGRVCGVWVWESVHAGCAGAARVWKQQCPESTTGMLQTTRKHSKSVSCAWATSASKHSGVPLSKQTPALDRPTAMAAKTPHSSRPSTPPSNYMPQPNYMPQQT